MQFLWSIYTFLNSPFKLSTNLFNSPINPMLCTQYKHSIFQHPWTKNIVFLFRFFFYLTEISCTICTKEKHCAWENFRCERMKTNVKLVKWLVWVYIRRLVCCVITVYVWVRLFWWHGSVVYFIHRLCSSFSSNLNGKRHKNTLREEKTTINCYL